MMTPIPAVVRLVELAERDQTPHPPTGDAVPESGVPAGTTDGGDTPVAGESPTLSSLPGRLSAAAVQAATPEQLRAWLAEASRIGRSSAVARLESALSSLPSDGATTPPAAVVDDLPTPADVRRHEAEGLVAERWSIWWALDAIVLDLELAGSPDEEEAAGAALRGALPRDASLDAVAWLADRVARSREREVMLRAVHEAEMRRACADTARLEALVPLLEEWLTAYPPRGKARSMPLPGTDARIGWRRVATRLIVEDHETAAAALEAALGWADAQDAIRTRRSVLPGEARALLEQRGIDEIEGATMRPGGDRFDVR